MAHQLSCDDEHSDGTINQYYRRYFPGIWIQHWSAGYDCPKKWGVALQRNRAYLLSGIIFSDGDGNHALSADTSCFSVYSATADYF